MINTTAAGPADMAESRIIGGVVLLHVDDDPRGMLPITGVEIILLHSRTEAVIILDEYLPAVGEVFGCAVTVCLVTGNYAIADINLCRRFQISRVGRSVTLRLPQRVGLQAELL